MLFECLRRKRLDGFLNSDFAKKWFSLTYIQVSRAGSLWWTVDGGRSVVSCEWRNVWLSQHYPLPFPDLSPHPPSPLPLPSLSPPSPPPSFPQAQPVSDHDFTQFRVLGRGGFGLVFGCMKDTTGQMYAMKTMNRKRVKMKKAEVC